MNTPDIWISLKHEGIESALQVVAQYPECNTILNYLIQHCIMDFGSPYTVSLDQEDNFQENIKWLSGVAYEHDIEAHFRRWLEYIDIGLQAPQSASQRRTIYNELLVHGQPVFVFDVNDMTIERRLLVDFGFAIALPHDGSQFEKGPANAPNA